MKTYVLKVEPFTKFEEPKAQALDGIVRAARKATGDAHLDASCISPAWRPGWHPLSNPYVRKALGIEG